MSLWPSKVMTADGEISSLDKILNIPQPPKLSAMIMRVFRSLEWSNNHRREIILLEFQHLKSLPGGFETTKEIYNRLVKNIYKLHKNAIIVINLMWEEYPHENFEIHPDLFINKVESGEEIYVDNGQQIVKIADLNKINIANIAIENNNLVIKVEESVIEAYIALHQYINFSNEILSKLLEIKVEKPLSPVGNHLPIELARLLEECLEEIILQNEPFPFSSQ